MKKFGYPNLLNYIDDLIYIGLPSDIHTFYQFLLQLLQDLGLEISTNKLVAPSTAVVCLGILVDSVNQTISIPDKKLCEIIDMCQSWKDKVTCTKQQLQSLLGSLLYITKCVHPARYFLNRMLQVPVPPYPGRKKHKQCGASEFITQVTSTVNFSIHEDK